MCSLFGMIDYNNKLTTKQKNRIVNVLAKECECRGIDATGIAYNLHGCLRVNKRPLPAHKMRLRVPHDVNVVMGHTRMATHGDPKDNYNNHPFHGICGGQQFALAHNGVLWNYKELCQILPKTDVKTDSYVAVQLLEQEQSLNFDSLKNMAETVEGSFVFTVLDADDSLYVVKGDHPFVIRGYHGFALYASTDSILEKAAVRLRLGPPAIIYEPEEGDILKIDSKGQVTYGRFIPKTSYPHWWRGCPYYGQYELVEEPFERDNLIEVGKTMGVSPDEIQALFDYGCTRGEIEELLYDPKLLHDLACELLYSY